MNKKQSSVNVDSSLVERALERAREKNLPHTLRGLMGYLLSQFNLGLLEINFNPDSFEWQTDTRTSISYEPELMTSVKKRISAKGFTPNNEFIVNLFLLNFIKNTN